MQDQQQVQRAGVILLGAGAGHHFQQGTDAALPLYRCIQHGALPGRKQAAEIPPGCVFQIMQHPQRKVAPHDLRHGAAGLCKAAAAGAKQHGAAGVYQHIPALVFQRDAALRHQQQIAGVLIRRQLVAVRIQTQGGSGHLAGDLFTF